MMWRNIAYALGLALALLLGFVARPNKIDHVWERLPFFEALFGFLGCLVIIFASKALGRLFIQKKESYYDD
jgi:hypothetical protein